MDKKKKLILSISVVTIFLALSLIAVKFLLDGEYRNQLPEYPDLKTVTQSLREQISTTGRKTYINPTTDNLGKLGMVYHSSAYYEKAAKCYELAVKKNNKRWIWSYYLGYLNLEQGESNAAIENFKHVIEKNPENLLALFYTGETFYNLGLRDSAEYVFKRIISFSNIDFDKKNLNIVNRSPLSTYAMFRLSRIYINSNRLDSAELTLNKILEKQIRFGPAYRLLGNIYTKKGNIELGNKYNIRANDLATYTPPVDPLIDNIALTSRSDKYLLKQIEEAFRNFNFEWAIMLCNHALKYIPDNKFLISKAIYGYLILGYGNEALPYLDQHIEFFSDDFKELMSVADLLYNKGFNSQAINYFNQAKKVEPENSSLALWLSARGMRKDAIILLNEQLKEEPENVKILSDAVHLLLNLGEKEMAMTYLSNLKRLSPNNSELKVLGGMIEEKEGNMKEALSIYENVFRNNPNERFIIKHLSNLYIRNKMWDKAINHFKLAINNFPNDPFLLEGLGRLLISCPDQKLRDLNYGMELSERAYISFNSSFANKISAGKNLAMAYAELGDSTKAFTLMNEVINIAKIRNVSQDYLNYLESMLNQYSSTN